MGNFLKHQKLRMQSSNDYN